MLERVVSPDFQLYKHGSRSTSTGVSVLSFHVPIARPLDTFVHISGTNVEATIKSSPDPASDLR